jgi:hypothetical protein
LTFLCALFPKKRKEKKRKERGKKGGKVKDKQLDSLARLGMFPIYYLFSCGALSYTKILDFVASLLYPRTPPQSGQGKIERSKEAVDLEYSSIIEAECGKDKLFCKRSITKHTVQDFMSEHRVLIIGKIENVRCSSKKKSRLPFQQ